MSNPRRLVDLVPNARSYVAALSKRPNFAAAIAQPDALERKRATVAAMNSAELRSRRQVEPQLHDLQSRGLLASWEFMPLTGAVLLHVPSDKGAAGWDAIRGVHGLGRIMRNTGLHADGSDGGGGRSFAPNNDLLPPPWQPARVGAPAAWAHGITGKGVTIGFVDSGFDPDHKALRDAFRGTRPDGSIDPSYNFYDPVDGGKTPYDDRGHGTSTTSLAVGGKPGLETGIAPGAKFIAAKVFSGSGKASLATTLQGLAWMLAPRDADGNNPDPTRAPDIVNMSFGGRDGSSLKYFPSLEGFAAAGILPVAAAGNGGPAMGSINAPGSYPQTLTVGATDNADRVWKRSGHGPSPLPAPGGGKLVKPDIVAPGVDTLSASRGGLYWTFTGTSAATPVAAGVAALVKSAHPNFSAEQVRAALAAGAQDLEQPGIDYTSGAGRIDVGGALRSADRMAQGMTVKMPPVAEHPEPTDGPPLS